MPLQGPLLSLLQHILGMPIQKIDLFNLRLHPQLDHRRLVVEIGLVGLRLGLVLDIIAQVHSLIEGVDK